MGDAIEIVPYDSAWPAHFDVEANRLRTALGAAALRIDHVGSTAVPGLDAKPIIDIQISVAEVRNADGYRIPLEELGYLYTHDPDFPEYPFFGKPHAYPRTHHVHVCTAGGPEEHRHLAFRDYLRSHADVAQEYAAFKRRIAPRFRAEVYEDRVAYADAKSAFIDPVQREALRLYPGPP